MRIDGLSPHGGWASLPKLRAGRDDFVLRLDAAMPLAIAAPAVFCGLKGTLAQGRPIPIAARTPSLHHFSRRAAARGTTFALHALAARNLPRARERSAVAPYWR